jgi:hypothetical protein
MKKKIILSYLGLSLLFISSFAQCTLCSPFWATNQGTISTNLFNDWSFAYINGDWGQDYVAFQAEAGKAYMFTTLPQFGGATQGISQNDAQLTIVNFFYEKNGLNCLKSQYPKGNSAISYSSGRNESRYIPVAGTRLQRKL